MKSSLKSLDNVIEDNFKVSVWMFAPERTAEELELFALTGSIPAPPRTNDKRPEPVVNFPRNPVEGQKFFDLGTGGYFVWLGHSWRKVANTPVPKPAVSASMASKGRKMVTKDSLMDLKELAMERFSTLKIPVFVDAYKSKVWCAEKLSEILECKITVKEVAELGIIIVETPYSERVFNHGVVNWGWNDKNVEEFREHLFNIWSLTVDPGEVEKVYYNLFSSREVVE